MGRWAPDAQERLREAAVALFEARGYDRTTVEEIAERAGLTERTFFRYFADKREVLFSGSKELEAAMVGGLAGAPPALPPLDAVALALEAAAPLLEPRRAHARWRRALVAAHADLRERELIKLASLSAALASGLCARGLPPRSSGLVAETGLALFKSAFDRWVDDARGRPLPHHLRAAMAELRRAMAASARASHSTRR